jgi:hypothetical protein
LEKSRLRAIHIPKFINICKDEDIKKLLTLDDVIIIYCTDEACNKSILLYQQIEAFAYEKIFRFAGRLRAWKTAGYELAGEMVA